MDLIGFKQTLYKYGIINEINKNINYFFGTNKISNQKKKKGLVAQNGAILVALYLWVSHVIREWSYRAVS